MFILDIIGIVTCFFTVSIYSISTGSNIETTMFNACASSLVIYRINNYKRYKRCLQMKAKILVYGIFIIFLVVFLFITSPIENMVRRVSR